MSARHIDSVQVFRGSDKEDVTVVAADGPVDLRTGPQCGPSAVDDCEVLNQ